MLSCEFRCRVWRSSACAWTCRPGCATAASAWWCSGSSTSLVPSLAPRLDPAQVLKALFKFLLNLSQSKYNKSSIFRELGLGHHMVHCQHPRLWCSHLWDDEDQEDFPPPRANHERLWRPCRDSQRHYQLHSLELVCVSIFFMISSVLITTSRSIDLTPRMRDSYSC